MRTRRIPTPVAQFERHEALSMLLDYQDDPTNVSCPTCGPEMLEVVGFIDPKGCDEFGVATEVQPVGRYAAALHCFRCRRSIAILVGNER